MALPFGWYMTLGRLFKLPVSQFFIHKMVIIVIMCGVVMKIQ